MKTLADERLLDEVTDPRLKETLSAFLLAIYFEAEATPRPSASARRR